jgi:hypothetical protein
MAQEFSLDKTDSVLNKLIRQMESTQQQVKAEFTLDNKESALSRVRAELAEITNAHRTDSANFQQEGLILGFEDMIEFRLCPLCACPLCAA